MKQRLILLSLLMAGAWSCHQVHESKGPGPQSEVAVPHPEPLPPPLLEAELQSPKRCQASQLQSCVRGMYVSTQNVLGDENKEKQLFDYAQRHDIKVLSLYDLQFILRSATETEALLSFMKRARESGIQSLEAIANEKLEEWDLIADFHRDKVPFDALLTEIEFWHGTPDEISKKFAGYLAALQHMRGLQLKTATGEDVRIKTYLGWFDAGQAHDIVRLVDEVYMHAYVRHPSQAFGHTQSRLKLLFDAMKELDRKISLKPIFSAEGPDKQAPGGEPFMGGWIQANPDPLRTADAIYLGESEAQGFLGPMTGTQYFLYDILQHYYP